MKWKFWKKEEAPKRELRRLEIPAERVREIRRLSDEYYGLPARQDKEAHYILWTAVAEIFPEVREGRWRLEFPNAFRAEVVEWARDGE